MYRILKKVIALMLVLTLAGANLSILGMYGITYALTDDELAKQSELTENSNVEFNSYFEDGGHSKTENIDTATNLLVNIKVKDVGYLKNSLIHFENVNFKIGEFESANVQSIDVENNKIILKQLNNGSDVTLQIPIFILNVDSVEQDHFSKETKTIFNGTYVDSNGKEKAVSKEVINRLSWNGEAEGEVTGEVTKYIPYKIGNRYGVMIQAKINTGIKDSKLPIKETQISVQVPEIKKAKPAEVKVIAKNTKATNGKENGIDFAKENYEYDKEKAVVEINTKNEENKISWLKNVTDEYIVTFIYDGEEIYEEVVKNGVDTQILVNGNIEVYNNKELVLPVSKTIEIKEKEQKGQMIDFNIAVTDKISKGQIYTNYDSNVKKEVEYLVRFTGTVYDADFVDSVKFVQDVDKFLTSKDKEFLTTVSGKNYTYNKTVKVNVELFNKILGEEGTIDILRKDETKIATINKETEVIDGNYVVDISSQDVNEIIIETSKPEQEGQIIVDIEKAIKEDIGYGKEQVKLFEKMESKLIGEGLGVKEEKAVQTTFTEPTSVAKVEISKKDLTTVVKNENVEIRAILNTSDVTNALYKNPTLKIKLPSHISKVEIKDKDILMANGLKLGKPEITTEKGSKVISIKLEGTQKEYTEEADYEGTIIVLNTDLTVKTLTPTNSNKITMEYTNENKESTNKEGIAQTELNFVAPAGVVAANGISGYAQNEEDILSIADENKAGKLAVYSEAKEVTVSGKVINNYENSIKNVVIVGRIPAKDNKNMDTQNSLGSTFDTKLKGDITVSGIESTKYEVYYSENIDEEKDAQSGWSNVRTENAKSYKIVIKEEELGKGKTIDFSYKVEVPANLKHNNSAYEMYKVYYNNASTIGEMEETKTSSIVGLETGEGPELEVKLNNTAEVIREGQIVRLDVTVKNTGAQDAENVVAKAVKPDKATFVKYNQSGKNIVTVDSDTFELFVGTIKAKAEKIVSYCIKIDNNVVGSGSEVYTKTSVSASVQGIEGEVRSNELSLPILEGSLSIALCCADDLDFYLQGGDSFGLNVNLECLSEKLENVVVTLPLPNGISCEVGSGFSYDKESNEVQIKIDSLEAGDTKKIRIRLDSTMVNRNS